MKEQLLQLVVREPVERRANLAREYLQYYLLRVLHEEGALAKLAFVGGTALRLLFQLPRFSEDIDFTATGALKPALLFAALGREAERAGYQVRVKSKPEKTVASAFVRFSGLPKEGGWSRDPRIGISIKVDIDLKPPVGAHVDTTLLQRFFPVAVRHHDLPSLFAGKLHALLSRPYAKGRDWFDLVWYLTVHKGLQPNAELLLAALAQTGGVLSPDGWRASVRERLKGLEWKTVLRDLEPFVERQSDLEVLTEDHVEELLR